VFIVVVAKAELGHDPLPRAESALAVLDVRSVWRLETRACMGILSMGDRSRVDPALELLGRHATGPAGASPVFTELRQAADATRLAQLALDTHRGGAGVQQIRDRPLTLLLAAAPEAALEAAHTVLGGVLGLPPEDRDLLLATFDAWIDGGGSAQVAAAALFCHPNTVRYRLRRIETAAGRSLTDPADLAELVAAARAWGQLPHPAAH
jgi:DNA-binding PucR family transcriptional regulator